MGIKNRIRAVYGIDMKVTKAVLRQSKATIEGVDRHPELFLPPVAVVEQLKPDVEVLDKAEIAVTAGTGTAAQRDAVLLPVVNGLDGFRVFVQGLMDRNPEKARLYLEASAMREAQHPHHLKHILEGKPGEKKGSVVLTANAAALIAERGSKAKNITFHWQYTLDGEETFVRALSTPVADTEIHDLPYDVEIGFYVCIGDSAGVGEWSQPFKLTLRS